jgi:mRNA deadenylase 3'-5' endonuclease subunit Ccr4
MQYNILAEIYGQPDHHSHCPNDYLKWGYRRQMVAQEMINSKADIITIQVLTN